eukprot:s1108_g12.t1
MGSDVLPSLQATQVTVPERRALQALLNDTFLHRRSCDRRGPLPTRLRLRGAFRGDGCRKDFEQWRSIFLEQYPEGAEELPPIRTQRFAETRGVEPRINECYLFHGTCWQNAVEILRRGFRSPEAVPSAEVASAETRRRMAPMFRGGIFFAECSSKADEYSHPPWHTLLLCRALLGKPLRRRGERRQRVKEMLEAQQADSVVCDLEATCHSYREFVLADPCQVLPEYLLVYERIFRKGRQRNGR